MPCLVLLVSSLASIPEHILTSILAHGDGLGAIQPGDVMSIGKWHG